MKSLQNFSMTTEGQTAFVDCESASDADAVRGELIGLCEQARRQGCDSISIRVGRRVMTGPMPICVGDGCCDLVGDTVSVGKGFDITVPSP